MGMRIVLLLVATGCSPPADAPWALRPIGDAHVFPVRADDGAVVPDGITIDARTLNRGRMHYVNYCASCHGLDGDGKGPDGDADPPPRDLRRGDYKFAAVRSGELANDADLHRMIRHGMNGTRMTGWELPRGDVDELAQFIKTFPGSRWGARYQSGRKKGKPKPTGRPVQLEADPWSSADEAAAAGRVLYHDKVQCSSCHPNYAVEPPTQARVSGPDDNPYGVAIRATELRAGPLRSVREDHQVADLARVIAAGVGGVMPAWIDGLDQKEIWALAHYVGSLRTSQ